MARGLLEKYLHDPALYRIRGYDINQQGRPIQRGASCVPDRFHNYGNYLKNPAPHIDLMMGQKKSAQAIAIPFDDLNNIAQELDQKIGGNWVHRVKDALSGLHKVTKSGLRQAKELRLNGKEHLLGPCAAGKSTLFAVAAIWLERNDYTCAIVYRDVRSLLNQADLFHRVGCSPGVVK